MIAPEKVFRILSGRFWREELVLPIQVRRQDAQAYLRWAPSTRDARIAPEPPLWELSASDGKQPGTSGNGGSYVDVRMDTDTQTLPGISAPTEALGFFIASINRRGIVFEENYASELMGSRG